MGVDCRILLPPTVRVRDVAIVIGKALGYPQVDSVFENRGRQCRATTVPLVTVEQTNVSPGLAWIKTPDHGWFLYHFEGDQAGERVMLPRSTLLAVAVARCLVDFFGGSADFSDIDGPNPDYRKPPTYRTYPNDGKRWQDFQDRLASVTPITKGELAWASKRAYYTEAAGVL